MMVPMMFWAVGIDTSFENFIWIFIIAALSGFVYCAQGFFWGLLIKDEDQVQQANIFTVMIFLCTNGSLVNLKDANLLVRAIGVISPARLSNEAFFRSMIFGIYPIDYAGIVTSQEKILEQKDYNYSRLICIAGLGGWLLFWIIATLIVAKIRLAKI